MTSNEMVDVETMVRPTADQIAAINLPTATIHEASGQRGNLPPQIMAVDPAMRICGPAITVGSPTGDNLRIHHALFLAKPGDVLVVAVDSDTPYGYWGEIMTVAAHTRQLGGLVIEGCVRDRDRLIEIGFPVFAGGLCMRGTNKDPKRTGSINAPITIGDIRIRPGDIVVGDADGVVIVERDEVDTVAAASAAREASEVDIIARIRAGERTIDMFKSSLSDLSND